MLTTSIMEERKSNMANSEYKFLGNIVLKGKIETITGMHIGGSKEKLEIGGVDSPVIRNPLTNTPYIPGSSLKGKMRMLTEFAQGKIKPDKNNKCGPYESDDPNEPIGRIFGNASKAPKGPSRLIVRDANPDNETVEKWKKLDSELHLTELKPENTIDRLTSEANPRFLERVVAGSFFDFEMLYGIYDMQNEGGKLDKENFKLVIEGLRLLEHSGIGGSVSRGYGKIAFKVADPIYVSCEEYRSGGSNYELSVAPVQMDNLKSLDKIKLPF